MTFKSFWKNFTTVEKALSDKELEKVNALIDKLEDARVPSSKIIARLQREFPDLAEQYQAERAYWTESKRRETNMIREGAVDLGIKKFHVVNTPGACVECRKVSGNGDRVYTNKEIAKGGKDLVPVHPNCYCILIPID